MTAVTGHVVTLVAETLPVDLATIRETITRAEALRLLSPRTEIDELSTLLCGHLALLLAEGIGDEARFREVYRRAYSFLGMARQIGPQTPNHQAWEHMRRLGSMTRNCARLWEIDQAGGDGE